MQVRIRQWEDMEREFGLDSCGDIEVNSDWCFVSLMKDMCGNVINLTKEQEFDLKYEDSFELEGFHYCKEMLVGGEGIQLLINSESLFSIAPPILQKWANRKGARLLIIDKGYTTTPESADEFTCSYYIDNKELIQGEPMDVLELEDGTFYLLREDYDLIDLFKTEEHFSDEGVKLVELPIGTKYKILEDAVGKEIIVEDGHWWI